MLNANPDERIELRAALDHPWVRENKKTMVNIK